MLTFFTLYPCTFANFAYCCSQLTMCSSLGVSHNALVVGCSSRMEGVTCFWISHCQCISSRMLKWCYSSVLVSQYVSNYWWNYHAWYVGVVDGMFSTATSVNSSDQLDLLVLVSLSLVKKYVIESSLQVRFFNVAIIFFSGWIGIGNRFSWLSFWWQLSSLLPPKQLQQEIINFFNHQQKKHW